MISKMGTKHGPAMGLGIGLLALILVAVKQTNAQVTARSYGKPFLPTTTPATSPDLLLKSVDEAKEACEANGLVLATKAQVEALPTLNGGTFKLTKCGFMADGKAGKLDTAGTTFKACADKPTAPAGYNAWCIEAPDYTCPTGWTWLPDTLSCFLFAPKDKNASTFAEAKTKCGNLGGYLATIDTVAEQTALEKMALTPAFIGVNDGMWNDGTMRKATPPTGVTYDPATPATPATPKCAGVDKAKAKKWSRLDCATKNAFICEMDLGFAPNYTVTYRTRYAINMPKGRCFDGAHKLLTGEIFKSYKNKVLCTGATVVGPTISYSAYTTTSNSATSKIWVYYIKETFTITSKNYTDSLVCARNLPSKLPPQVKRARLEKDCPEISVASTRYKVNERINCGGYDVYDGKRSCLSPLKGCTTFKKTAAKGLFAKQFPVPVNGDDYVMTPEKCEALCKNRKDFQCLSFAIKVTAGGKPNKNECKLSPQKLTLYEGAKLPDVPTSTYYERICPFEIAPSIVILDIQLTYKPKTKPACVANQTLFRNASYAISNAFHDDIPKAVAKALKSSTKCGYVAGMGLVGLDIRIDTALPITSTADGSVKLQAFVNIIPLSHFILENDKFISDCLTDLKVTYSPKYSYGPGCETKGDAEVLLVTTAPPPTPYPGGDRCGFLTGRPRPYSKYLPEKLNGKEFCFNERPWGFMAKKDGKCTATGTAVVGKLSLPACSTQCRAVKCESFYYNNKTMSCEIMAKACGDAVKKVANVVYYEKQTVSCEKSSNKAYSDVRGYIKQVLEMYIGSGSRTELCSDDYFTKIQKSFMALNVSCDWQQVINLGISLGVANKYRNFTCSTSIRWAKLTEPATCKLVEAKTEVIQLMSQVIDAEIGSWGQQFTISKKFIIVKRSVMTKLSTCSHQTQYSVFEGFSYMFYMLRMITPDIEPFLGPKEDCQDQFVNDAAVDLVELQASANKGAKVDSADICRKFTTLAQSLTLVNSCRPTTKQGAVMMVQAFNQTMVATCKQSSAECVKSTFMQCLQKRTHQLTMAVVEGKGIYSQICINRTKENFNAEMNKCLTNTTGCDGSSVIVSSRIISSLFHEFLFICTKTENQWLNLQLYLAFATKNESKECKSAEATVCQKSLSTNMFNNIAAGEASQSLTCSAFEVTVSCVKASIKSCSPWTKLNQLESLLMRRTEILATQTDVSDISKPTICAFNETTACYKQIDTIGIQIKVAASKIRFGKLDCTEVTRLRGIIRAFINSKVCGEITNMYVEAAIEAIEFVVRDSCSACGRSTSLANIYKYFNGFLKASLEFRKFNESDICTDALPDFLLVGSFEGVVSDCKSGGAKVVAIAKRFVMHKSRLCKMRDFTWVPVKNDTCSFTTIDACYAAFYQNDILAKIAGDDESRRQVCVHFRLLSVCVRAVVKTCKTPLMITESLGGVALIRSNLLGVCDMRPKDKECNLEKATECFTIFVDAFDAHRLLVLGGKKPDAKVICGLGMLTIKCTQKYTMKCGAEVEDVVLYLTTAVNLYYGHIKATCDAIKKEPCDKSQAIKCLSAFAKNVTETMTMVDRRTAFLCKTSVEKKMEMCAAESTLDCGDRTLSFVQVIQGLTTSTKTICKQLICRQDEAKANILFILDASGSVGSTNFGTCKDFFKEIVEKLDVGKNRIRVSAMTYASIVVDSFGFDRFYTEDKLTDAIEEIRYTKGYTYTDMALQMAERRIAAIQKKRGKTIPTIVIITTDGEATNHKKTIKAAAKLKKLPNLTVYAIGIGKNIDPRELKAISTNNKTAYTVADFDKLDDIIDDLSQGITCEGLNKTGTTGITDPVTCNVTEAQMCVAKYEIDVVLALAKDGPNQVRVACLLYKESLECLKTKLVTCSGPTEFRYVEALYLLIQSSMTICKEFLPKPRETCKLEEAKKCFKELKTTISEVTVGDYRKVCTEINEKQGCVYDRVAGCTDFTTYFWLAHVNAITYHVKTTKKCQGIIKPPVVTGKECDDAEATKCMFEFEEHAVQSVFTNSFGTLCLKLPELIKCITGPSPECTKKQREARMKRFMIKRSQIEPECITMKEVTECKFKEIREKLEGFTKEMLKSLMLEMKSDKLCDRLQDALTFAMDNKGKCSGATKSQIDALAFLVMGQLTEECKQISYAADVKPSCDVTPVKKYFSRFNGTVYREMARGGLKYCDRMVTAKQFIDLGVKDCPDDEKDTINKQWAALVVKIGSSCTKRFDVNFQTTKITVFEGISVRVSYKFTGCMNALCEGNADCKVKIFQTLTNIRGSARCSAKDRYLIQGTFAPAADGCGFDLTQQNCANEFTLVVHGRVFYVKSRNEHRDVIFYAQVTINGAVTIKQLDTKLGVTFEHNAAWLDRPCKVWGDPHIAGLFVPRRFTILKDAIVQLMHHKPASGVIGKDIDAIFTKCRGYKKQVSCMCAIYIQCGGGVIKFGDCARKGPKRGTKCKNKNGFGGECSKNVPKKNFMEVEAMYNGNVDQCQIFQRTNYMYDVFQANGRRITVRMFYPKSLRVLSSAIYHLPTDRRDTEGLCLSSKTTWKKYDLSATFGASLAAENWRAYTAPPTPPSCLCTTSGAGNDRKFSSSCQRFQRWMGCYYIRKGKNQEITNDVWKSARKVSQSTSRSKRALATNPFAMDPTATVNDAWGTYNEMTAKKACETAYANYKTLKSCLDQTKMNYTVYFDQCVGDIKASDTLTFTENSCSAAFTACINLLTANTTYMNSAAGQAMATQIASQTCPSDCTNSIQGKCVAGVCSCIDPWTGEACDVNKNDKPVIISIGSNGGVCDPATTDCATIMVQAGSVQFIPTLTCHYLEQKFGPTTQSDVGQAGKVRGENVGGSVRCVLPKSASYLIALSNDGKEASGPVTYLVYNPKCETCNITAGTCKPLPEAVCRIGDNCYSEGESLASDDCLVCNTKASTTKLIKKQTVKCGHSGKKDGLDTTDIIIIAVTVGGIVVGLAAFLIYKFAVKPNLDAKAKAEAINKEQDLQQESPPKEAPGYRPTSIQVRGGAGTST